jgi:hypothetical protein
MNKSVGQINDILVLGQRSQRLQTLTFSGTTSGDVDSQSR